jgi:hypothetical protein
VAAPGSFASYFRLRERCRSCGHRFAPDEGFFLGVFVFNFAIVEGLLFVGLMAYILAMGTTGGTVPVLLVLAVGIAFAIGASVVFYPFAASTWAAIELAMHPPRATGEAGGVGTPRRRARPAMSLTSRLALRLAAALSEPAVAVLDWDFPRQEWRTSR